MSSPSGNWLQQLQAEYQRGYDLGAIHGMERAANAIDLAIKTSSELIGCSDRMEVEELRSVVNSLRSILVDAVAEARKDYGHG